MKKMVFVLLFSICSLASKAQLQFGVKGGFSLSSFVVPDPFLGVSYSSKPDFNGGFLLSVPMGSGGLTFQPEVVYSGEGAHVNVSGIKGDYNLQMLNFPLLLKYKAPAGYFFEAGPQVGFLLSGDLTEDGFGSRNIREDSKSPTFSVAFGLGYQLPMNLGIDLRYNWGLTNLAKSGNQAYNNPTIRNNVIQIGIYYIFSSPPATAP
jgi:hypothetical protein